MPPNPAGPEPAVHPTWSSVPGFVVQDMPGRWAVRAARAWANRCRSSLCSRLRLCCRLRFLCSRLSWLFLLSQCFLLLFLLKQHRSLCLHFFLQFRSQKVLNCQRNSKCQQGGYEPADDADTDEQRDPSPPAAAGSERSELGVQPGHYSGRTGTAAAYCSAPSEHCLGDGVSASARAERAIEGGERAAPVGTDEGACSHRNHPPLRGQGRR